MLVPGWSQLGRLLFHAVIGDLTTANHFPQWLAETPADAAAAVITWLGTLMGAVGGAALAWQLPLRPLSEWFSCRKQP